MGLIHAHFGENGKKLLSWEITSLKVLGEVCVFQRVIRNRREKLPRAADPSASHGREHEGVVLAVLPSWGLGLCLV